MSRRDYVGESESMDAILASDRFIEQLRTSGTFEPTSREDAALASALLDWRDEVREEPITPAPRVDDLDLARLNRQPGRIARRSVAVAAALLAMSSAAATAFDGDPLRPVRFLVDLGVTVGEGIGNPDDDSSTDGVEPNPQEIGGDDAAGEEPGTSVPSGSVPSVPESNNTDGAKDPGSPSSSEATDPADGSEEEPPEILPTGEAPPEEEPPLEEEPVEEEPPVDEPGDGAETETPAPTPTPTDGQTEEPSDGETDGSPPDDQGESPDEPTPGEGAPEPEPDEPTEPDQSSAPPGSDQSDDAPPGAAGHAEHRRSDVTMGASDRVHPHQKAAWKTSHPSDSRTTTFFSSQVRRILSLVISRPALG